MSLSNRVFLSLLLCGFTFTLQTIFANPDDIKKGSSSHGQAPIPVLSMNNLTPAMIDRIVKVARRDAEAIFGGPAHFHTILFDNVGDTNGCKNAFGARVIFANADLREAERRPFAMYTIDPLPSSQTRCSNSILAGPKWVEDVKIPISGTRNIEKSLGSFGRSSTTFGIKLSMEEAFKKAKQENPKFEGPLGISIINPENQMMRSSPWAMIYATSSQGTGVVYVNLTTGKTAKSLRPVKNE